MNKKISKFKWSDLGLINSATKEDNRLKLQEWIEGVLIDELPNSDNYTTFLFALISDPETEVHLNAHCIYMNKKNVDKIYGLVNDIGAGYMPVIDDALKSNEFAVDLDDIFFNDSIEAYTNDIDVDFIPEV